MDVHSRPARQDQEVNLETVVVRHFQGVKKWLGTVLVTILAALLMAGSFSMLEPATAHAEISSVAVSGDGVEKETVFSQADLEAMTQVQVKYSTINTWPTKKWYVAEGVRLTDLLQKAGINEEATLITVESIDGYKMTFTRQELLNDTRYCFPGLKENAEYDGSVPGSPEEAVPVEALLALKSVENSDNPDYMNDQVAPLLVFGQRWVTEQTNHAFAKYVSTIEVSTAAPQKWDNPTATPAEGSVPAGTLVELQSEFNDADKVYYTTDDSDPSYKSLIYNWIARRWWSSRGDDVAIINKPIELTRDTTIKAITIGIGRQDSDIVTFNYQVVLNPAPVLSAENTPNTVRQAVDLSFTDAPTWVEAIQAVTVDGVTLETGQYSKDTPGKITINGDVFSAPGEYVIVIEATGYEDASITLTVIASDLKAAPALTADTTENVVGSPVVLTFTDDPDWRGAISEVRVDGGVLDDEQYSKDTPGEITINAEVFRAAGEYAIVIQASGYDEAIVTQTMIAPIKLTTPTKDQEFTQGAWVVIQGTAEAAWTALEVQVTGPQGQTVYGPLEIEIIDQNFATSFMLDSSAPTGKYLITLDGGSLVDPITGTFTVTAEGGVIKPIGDVVLTITGSGVSKEVELTLEELEAMEQLEQVYSAINTWPTKKWYIGEGVSLEDLLDLAGMRTYSGLIKFTAEDGYTMTLTVKELLNDTRYYFPNFKDGSDGDGHMPGSSDNEQEVEPMVALISAEGTDDSGYMNDLNSLLFMLGQRAVTEQNGQLFVKNLNKIEVIDASPSRWDTPRAYPDSGEVPAGTLVKLSNDNMDDDKIHYTTDGTTPTIDSPMYNWIAHRWWSSREDVLDIINHPIEINENTTIKAITIGPGKKNSDVATFTYQVSEAIGNKTETVLPDEENTLTLGDDVILVIPAYALQETSAVEVTIEKVAEPPALPTGLLLLGNVYKFSVDGNSSYQFARPVNIQLRFDPQMLGEGESPAIHYYDEALDQWINIGGTVSENLISVQVDYFGKFAVLVTKKELVITPKFTDVAGHWAQNTINELVALGAINGYPDGTFKPDHNITRAEFTTVLVKAFKLENKEDKSFADTAAHWAKDYISSAAAHGVVSGYDMYTFAPDDLITREQMAVMVCNAAKLPSTAEETYFTDSNQISAWARGAINVATNHKIMMGYPDNTIRPLNNATRAEAVTVIINTLNSNQ